MSRGWHYDGKYVYFAIGKTVRRTRPLRRRAGSKTPPGPRPPKPAVYHVTLWLYRTRVSVEWTRDGGFVGHGKWWDQTPEEYG